MYLKKNIREDARNEDERGMAAYFDRCFDQGLFISFESQEKERVTRLVQMFHIQKGWRILEPGCGCGRMTRLLAEEVGSEGTIEACELSPKMAAWCQKMPFPSWVNFYNLSVLDLDLSPASQDAIVCFNVWPHFTYPEIYVNCFRNFLKPGGYLLIAHSSGREAINSIHHHSCEETIKTHHLPSVEDLAAFLMNYDIKALDTLSQEDIYYIKAVKGAS